MSCIERRRKAVVADENTWKCSGQDRSQCLSHSCEKGDKRMCIIQARTQALLSLRLPSYV